MALNIICFKSIPNKVAHKLFDFAWGDHYPFRRIIEWFASPCIADITNCAFFTRILVTGICRTTILLIRKRVNTRSDTEDLALRTLWFRNKCWVNDLYV